MKILILKPSSLGDIVQALPVLRLLKQYLPASQIYWWIESGFAALLEGDPDLAGIVRFERRGWPAPKRWPALWQTIRWMREQAFDWVIDLQSLARSGAFAWLANGKLTVGLDEPREGARGFYDLIVRRPSFYTHAVDWYLQVLPLLGLQNDRDEQLSHSALLLDESFKWLPQRPAAAAAVHQKWRVNGSRWIILQPGARWSNKRWPAENFAELVKGLAGTRPEFCFAILGAAQDRPMAQIIARADERRCLDLTGQTSLPEMVEWIRLSELMVTNDTGPMHVAAALNKPVVAVFGPTEPRRTGPYGQVEQTLQISLPCIPCLNSRCTYSKPIECLKGLPAKAVIEAVQKRL